MSALHRASEGERASEPAILDLLIFRGRQANEQVESRESGMIAQYWVGSELGISNFKMKYFKLQLR